MSNLTDLLPAGAGGKQVSFVASGTIGNGVTVGLNSDGTVEAVGGASQEVGSPKVFETGSTVAGIPAFDSNSNKIVIGYRDDGNSSYGTAIVGTVSGTSISFGSPVVFNSSNSGFNSATFDSSANKIVIVYRDAGNSNYATAIVGTVSGSSISFGTSVVFESASVNYLSLTFDSNSNKVVISYADTGNSSYGTAIVGTVSGTSISFGSAVVFNSSSTNSGEPTFDSNLNKIVIPYRDNLSGDAGTAVVGTVSGTSISFGTPVVFNLAGTNDICSTFDSSSNKVVIAYKDGGKFNYGTAVVGTVSGTSISFGTPVIFENGVVDQNSITFDSNLNKVVIAYKDEDNSDYGTVITGTVSGTSINFNSPLVFENAETVVPQIVFDSNANKSVIAYRDGGNSDRGTSVVFETGSTNNADFIGISDAAISDTASGSVTIKGGISTNVTGLTPNSTYYVQADGSLSTTASDVLAGKALSSTSINLDYTT